jgi:hypothetical protein
LGDGRDHSAAGRQAAFQPPPPAGTLLVAILLFAAGLVVLGRLAIWGTALPRWPFVAGTWTLVAVFLGRS